MVSYNASNPEVITLCSQNIVGHSKSFHPERHDSTKKNSFVYYNQISCSKLHTTSKIVQLLMFPFKAAISSLIAYTEHLVLRLLVWLPTIAQIEAAMVPMGLAWYSVSIMTVSPDVVRIFSNINSPVRHVPIPVMLPLQAHPVTCNRIQIAATFQQNTGLLVNLHYGKSFMCDKQWGYILLMPHPTKFSY